MKTYRSYSLIAALVFTLAACEAAATPSTPIIYTLPPPPESRSFLLGMNPFPHDFSLEALDEAFEIAGNHADLLLYHLDSGVPWPEALAEEPYHAAVMENLEDLVSRRKPGQKLYLAITPNAPERNQIALYNGAEESMELPPEWRGKNFSDPDVVSAYLNHSRFMLDFLKPDYFAYGIEVTCDFTGPQDPLIDEFLVLAEEVYTTLKAENPDLPIFLTICTGSFQTDDLETLMASAERVLPYSDYVGISTYPYWVVPGMKIREANPTDLPDHWFAQWAALAPDKPFAITETGYPAEDLLMPEYGVKIKGNAAWQADYVAFMLESLDALDAEFIAWFIPRDYDQLYDFLTEQYGEFQFYKTWRDTGFYDGAGSVRPALSVWDQWLEAPVEDG